MGIEKTLAMGNGAQISQSGSSGKFSGVIKETLSAKPNQKREVQIKYKDGEVDRIVYTRSYYKPDGTYRGCAQFERFPDGVILCAGDGEYPDKVPIDNFSGPSRMLATLSELVNKTQIPLVKETLPPIIKSLEKKIDGEWKEDLEAEPNQSRFIDVTHKDGKIEKIVYTHSYDKTADAPESAVKIIYLLDGTLSCEIKGNPPDKVLTDSKSLSKSLLPALEEFYGKFSTDTANEFFDAILLPIIENLKKKVLGEKIESLRKFT